MTQLENEISQARSDLGDNINKLREKQGEPVLRLDVSGSVSWTGQNGWIESADWTFTRSGKPSPVPNVPRDVLKCLVITELCREGTVLEQKSPLVTHLNVGVGKEADVALGLDKRFTFQDNGCTLPNIAVAFPLPGSRLGGHCSLGDKADTCKQKKSLSVKGYVWVEGADPTAYRCASAF